MVLYLLGERICEPRETANAHSHGKVLSLHETGRNVPRVWVSTDRFHITADALCGGVPGVILDTGTANLLQLRVVHICTECTFDSF